MKYIICQECKDIVGAYRERAQYCFCGASGVLKANALDTSFVGPATVLSCKNSELDYLSDKDMEAATTTFWKVSSSDRFIYKSKGEDCGKRWGKERIRARRTMRHRNHKANIRVKMEWEPK